MLFTITVKKYHKLIITIMNIISLNDIITKTKTPKTELLCALCRIF